MNIIKRIIMAKRQLLLVSSSNVHGHEYLEHPRGEIEKLLNKNNVKTVLFVPFAAKDHDTYTEKVSETLSKWGYQVEGLHTKSNQVDAILLAEAIFVGGGNTFLLLKTLCDNKLIEAIRDRVLNDGIPYIGSSAGTNIATISIHTTNDMPIVYPSTFNALGLINFNINPHYLDPDPDSKHNGETRETRIKEFHHLNETPVLGLREGSALLVEKDIATLVGAANARLFLRDNKPTEYPPNSDLSFLFNLSNAV